MDIDPRQDALLVIDLQPDFMPGGPLPVKGGNDLAGQITELAPRFGTVVATQDWHPVGHISFASAHLGHQPFESMEIYGQLETIWPDHCVAGSSGAALHPALSRAATMILRKGTRLEVDSYSAFRENVGPDGRRAPTGLAGYLRERGVRRIFVCGLARDYCVKYSALDGAALGFETFVLDDLTRALAPERAPEVDLAFSEGRVRCIESRLSVAR